MKAGNLEDIYTLAPMQAGMLFHRLAANSDDLYLRQWSCRIDGKLDVLAFEQSWGQMLARHAMLRTSFHWEGMDKPVQVVHRNVSLPWRFYDWSEIAPPGQEKRIADIRVDQRQAGFKLSHPPLMNMALIRTRPGSYYFIWTYHHLIMDAWSRLLLFKEILKIYGDISIQLNTTPSKSRPYKDYIIWLKQQDQGLARTFWGEYLKECDGPLLNKGAIMEEGSRRDGFHEIQRDRVPEDTAAELRVLVGKYGLTLGTLFQGVWALILSHYFDRQDVVFGMVVSGRPADLEESNSIIGPFINTVPIRVRPPRHLSMILWLEELQKKMSELSQYEYCSLVDMQRWSGLPSGSPLFDTLLNINNLPADDLSLGELSIRDIHLEEGHPYPLIFQIVLGREILLSLPYDRRYISSVIVTSMLIGAQTLLSETLQNPQIEVSELGNILKDKDRQSQAMRIEKYLQLRGRKGWNL